jgi:hypothetical protein
LTTIMSSAQGHRRHDAHVHHRRVIDGVSSILQLYTLSLIL